MRVTERVGDALALLDIEDRAGVVVEDHVVSVEGAGVLGQRVERPTQRRPRLAVHRVCVRGRHDVGTGGVNLRVDDECGQIEGPVALDHVALVVDEQEVLDADLPEAHAERIDPEVVGVLGVPCRDVAGRALGEAEPPEETEGGGQALLAMPALLLARSRTRGKAWVIRSDGMGPVYGRLYRSVHRMRRVDFSLSEPERELVALCRDFAQNEIATRAPAAWEEARCPTDLLREMGELGLLGMLVPEEWGGIGMSTVGFVAAMEQIGLADQSVAAAWQAHVTIGSLPLYLFGDDAQRERWLRPLAEGRALGAFGLTEPDAGSDARGIRTRAERRDGGWVINGRKTFISNAGTDMSFGVTLLARTGRTGQHWRGDAGGGHVALRQLRRREGHPGLHHGTEDARDRLAGSRYTGAVLRRRLGPGRPPGR